jgi:acyl-CoA thioester hydrolase
MSAPPEGFRFCISQPVVLRDLDAFSHVNNAVYLTYAENGRVAYLKELVGAVTYQQIRNIMARVTIDFRAEASYGDVLTIGVRTERIGTKSFHLAYRIARQDGEIVADVASVQVMFDFDEGQTIAVPDDWRRAIEAYEGSPLGERRTEVGSEGQPGD